MPKRIKWPKGWDPNKGWLSAGSDHLLVTEPRTTGAWSLSLQKRGISLAERRCHLLGGPEVRGNNYGRTVESCKREIRAYYDANGVRPSVTSSIEWRKWNNWLRSQGTSISQLCDEMGLPAILNLERTMGDCKRDIRAYFKANGKRPTERASAGWNNWNQWLRRQGSSLSQICDELGLPAILNLKRMKADCVQEVRAYFKANGKRPSERASIEWRKWNAWLRSQGTSLSQLCDDLGLPALKNLERTKADCKREVRTYFKANGKRPSPRTSAGMNHWLRRQGTSLSKLCDEMGLPK